MIGGMSWVTTKGNGVRLTIKVMPRASQSAVCGVQGDALKIKLTAPPVDGKANEALVDFLCERLGTSRTRLQITHGATSRIKWVDVNGISESAARALLTPDE
jgi:uncharacterized protein (TIGR00251 family)